MHGKRLAASHPVHQPTDTDSGTATSIVTMTLHAMDSHPVRGVLRLINRLHAIIAMHIGMDAVAAAQEMSASL